MKSKKHVLSYIVPLFVAAVVLSSGYFISQAHAACTGVALDICSSPCQLQDAAIPNQGCIELRKFGKAYNLPLPNCQNDALEVEDVRCGTTFLGAYNAATQECTCDNVAVNQTVKKLANTNC